MNWLALAFVTMFPGQGVSGDLWGPPHNCIEYAEHVWAQAEAFQGDEPPDAMYENAIEECTAATDHDAYVIGLPYDLAKVYVAACPASSPVTYLQNMGADMWLPVCEE